MSQISCGNEIWLQDVNGATVVKWVYCCRGSDVAHRFGQDLPWQALRLGHDVTLDRYPRISELAAVLGIDDSDVRAELRDRLVIEPSPRHSRG